MNQVLSVDNVKTEISVDLFILKRDFQRHVPKVNDSMFHAKHNYGLTIEFRFKQTVTSGRLIQCPLIYLHMLYSYITF